MSRRTLYGQGARALAVAAGIPLVVAGAASGNVPWFTTGIGLCIAGATL